MNKVKVFEEWIRCEGEEPVIYGPLEEVTIDGRVNISKLMDLVIAEYIKVEDKPSSQS